jgi:hypothetical protein
VQGIGGTREDQTHRIRQEGGGRRAVAVEVMFHQQFPEACKSQYSSGIPTCLFVNCYAKM